MRRIPKEGRRTIETGFDLKEIKLLITRLDDETKEPQERYFASGGAQGLSIAVEWPLVGTADWTEPPTEENRWRISPDQLFDTLSERDMSCSDWLGQQVVLFNGQGITLGKLIRTIVNFEAAHAVNVDRLSVFEGETQSKAAKEPHIHILRNIAFFGVGYAELVVIEAGTYLFKRLLAEPSIERPNYPSDLVIHTLELSPKDVTSKRPSWLSYRGGIMVDFSPLPGVESFKVRAPT